MLCCRWRELQHRATPRQGQARAPSHFHKQSTNLRIPMMLLPASRAHRFLRSLLHKLIIQGRKHVLQGPLIVWRFTVLLFECCSSKCLKAPCLRVLYSEHMTLNRLRFTLCSEPTTLGSVCKMKGKGQTRCLAPAFCVLSCLNEKAIFFRRLTSKPRSTLALHRLAASEPHRPSNMAANT